MGALWSTVVVLGLALFRPFLPGLGALDRPGTIETVEFLMLEAAELCAGAAPRGALATRSAVAGELLTIVAELAQRRALDGERSRIEAWSRELEASCGTVVAGRTESPVRVGGDLSGSGRRRALHPYLDRLDGAAVAALAARNRGEPFPGAGARRPAAARASAMGAVGADRGEESAERNGSRGVGAPVPQVPGRRARRDPKPRPVAFGRVAKRPGILIEPVAPAVAARHRQWVELFVREAGRLRLIRRRLEIEIARDSLAAAGRACLEFGRDLDVMSATVVAGAPQYEMRQRLRRMLAAYRDGAANCRSGKPVRAFAALSEGDRHWARVAKLAAPYVGRARAGRRLR